MTRGITIERIRDERMQLDAFMNEAAAAARFKAEADARVRRQRARLDALTRGEEPDGPIIAAIEGNGSGAGPAEPANGPGPAPSELNQETWPYMPLASTGIKAAHRLALADCGIHSAGDLADRLRAGIGKQGFIPPVHGIGAKAAATIRDELIRWLDVHGLDGPDWAAPQPAAEPINASTEASE